jgi:hypothetical protein
MEAPPKDAVGEGKLVALGIKMIIRILHQY